MDDQLGIVAFFIYLRPVRVNLSQGVLQWRVWIRGRRKKRNRIVLESRPRPTDDLARTGNSKFFSPFEGGKSSNLSSRSRLFRGPVGFPAISNFYSDLKKLHGHSLAPIDADRRL